jgi:hypothetical protein
MVAAANTGTVAARTKNVIEAPSPRAEDGLTFSTTRDVEFGFGRRDAER